MAARGWHTRRTDTLPVGSVVLDDVRVAWQRSFDGRWRSTLGGFTHASELGETRGPVTVLSVPDPFVDADGRWRCPRCETNHVMRAHAETCCAATAAAASSSPEGTQQP